MKFKIIIIFLSKASTTDGDLPKQPRKARKRKHVESSSASPSKISPNNDHRFQAKQARLGKITDILMDKITTVNITSSTPTIKASQARTSIARYDYSKSNTNFRFQSSGFLNFVLFTC